MAEKNTISEQQSLNISNSSTDTASNQAKSTDNDPELDNLLDSALSDFDSVPKPVHTVDESKPLSSTSLPPPLPPAPHTTQFAAPDLQQGNNDEMFNEVFNAAFGGGGGGMGGEEGASQLEDMLKAFLDPETLKNIEKITEAAGSTDETEESKKQFEDTIKQTLGSLAQNAEKLQNDVPEDDLLKMMAGMNFGAGANPEDEQAGDMGEFMPMMQTMMKSLISKEVLYPSLKEISEKYPSWLVENKDKISEEEYIRYTQQQSAMRAICELFEEEQPEDTDPVKQERFARILDMMQSMEQLGFPPKELTGDMPGFPGMPGGFPTEGLPQGVPPMEFDENGMPKMPANPEQCSIM